MRSEHFAVEAGRYYVLGRARWACSELLLLLFSLVNSEGGDNTIRSNNIFHMHL